MVLPIDQRGKQGNQSNLKDRVWLEKTYLPSLSGDILYVGISYYTDFYHELVKTPSSFVTVDLDPEMEKFGSPYGHYTDSVEHLLQSSGKNFDHISLFGLFGCGHSVIKDHGKIIEILNLAYGHTKTNGTLQFGTSTNSFSMEDAKSFVLKSNLQRLTTIESFVVKPSIHHSDMFLFWGRKSND